jgi:hypothetical protein
MANLVTLLREKYESVRLDLIGGIDLDNTICQY